MTNELVKTEEVEKASGSAQTATTADVELTEEQLEIVAGGTGGEDRPGGCIPKYPPTKITPITEY